MSVLLVFSLFYILLVPTPMCNVTFGFRKFSLNGTLKAKPVKVKRRSGQASRPNNKHDESVSDVPPSDWRRSLSRVHKCGRWKRGTCKAPQQGMCCKVPRVIIISCARGSFKQSFLYKRVKVFPAIKCYITQNSTAEKKVKRALKPTE
jgi:hypothetical protein